MTVGNGVAWKDWFTGGQVTVKVTATPLRVEPPAEYERGWQCSSCRSAAIFRVLVIGTGTGPLRSVVRNFLCESCFLELAKMMWEEVH